MNTLFVGIDVSSTSNVICFMNPDGSKHSSFSVQNNLNGSKMLSKRVVSAMGSDTFSNVIFGLESTSVYGDNLVNFLREDFSLSDYDKKIHILNAKQVRKFKDSYPELPKNDYVDSFIIADNLRFGRIAKEVYMDDYRYKVTRARFFAVQNLTKEKQRFLNYLFMKFSTLKSDKVFSDIFGNTSLSVITEFMSVDEIAYCDLQTLVDFICEKGKNRFENPEEVRRLYKLPLVPLTACRKP